MGTIVIEEYQRTGTDQNGDIPVYNLAKLTRRTADATTSTTPESLVLQPATAIVRIYTEEIHRIATSAANTGDSQTYFTTQAAKWHDLAVDAGSTLHYRLNS